MAEVPTGGTRVAYAYLATVVSGLGALLLTAIAWPVLSMMNICSVDDTGLCRPIWWGVLWVVFMAAVSVGVAWGVRLGWWWVAWMVMGVLLVGQIVLQTEFWWGAAAVVLVPAAAALATTPDGADALRGRRRWVVGALLAAAAAQWIVWLVLLFR